MEKIDTFLIKNIFLILFLIFFPYKNYAQMDTTNIYHNKYEKFLIENSIPIYYIDDKFIVDKNIEEVDLVRFFMLLQLESDIIADNIANANTTRTAEGEPFRRNILIIDSGKIEIIKDDSPIRLVYDPTHPDSIRNGEYKGYVEYPNVDIVSEMVNLIAVSIIYETIIEDCELKNIPVPNEYKK